MNNAKSKLGGMLGLARKAGKIVSGADKVTELLRGGRKAYILLASNASERTRKRVKEVCAESGVECAESKCEMAVLSGYLGLPGDTSAVAVTDKNFIKAVKNIIETDMDADAAETAGHGGAMNDNQ